MAQKVQFLGFKRVLTGAQMQDNYLYFVRDAGELEGKLWFNGVCYGSCRDAEIDKILEALDGFISGSTVTDVKQYIDDAIAELEAGFDSTASGESADGHVSVKVDMENGQLTAVTVTTSDIASADDLAEEVSARTTADTALQAEIDAIETAVGLANDGTYVAGDGQFTSAATSVADAIDKLDDALASAVTDIETEIENKINALDADESGASTYVNVRVQEEDGVITEVSVDDSALEAAIEAMDLAEVHEAGKAIVAVSEEDGIVSATAGTIAAQYVDVADADNHFTANNVEAALAELYTGYTAGDAAIVGDATASGDTLGKLEDRIEELATDAKEYHLVKSTTGLPETIKERYSLVDADGNVSGDTVDIPKDSHIVSINYITDSGDPHYQNLEYVYIDASGETRTTYVDMSEIVLESEFASGVTAIDGVVRGVVDPASETFLTVGADGFKLSGVQDAIDDAVDAEEQARKEADSAITEDLETTAATLVQMIEDAKDAATTKVVEGTDAGNNMEIVPTTGADDSVTYTINLTDIASASALTQEISDREDADEALDDKIDAVSAATDTAIAEEEEARKDADEDLQEQIDALSGSTDEELEKLQAELDAVEGSLGFTDTAYTNSGIYISGETVTGDIKLLDTALDTIEDRFTDALQKEIDDRESGDTAIMESLAETASTLTDMIKDEESARTQADNALDARLDAIEDTYLTGVTVNGNDATVANNHATVTVDASDISGASVTGNTAISGDTVDEVLQEIVDALNGAVAGSYTGVTSTGNTLAITGNQGNLGQNVEFVKEASSVSSAQEGHIELAQNSNHEWYGQMYWIDEETGE